jgi:hypothetical protein
VHGGTSGSEDPEKAGLKGLQNHSHGFLINTKLIGQWCTMRNRALSKTYESLPSFKRIIKIFSKKTISNFIRQFRVPRNLYLSKHEIKDHCSGGSGNKKENKNDVENKTSPKGSVEKFIKLKKFFNTLPLDVVNSLKVRRAIVNFEGKTHQPDYTYKYRNYSNGLSVNSFKEKVSINRKDDLFKIDYNSDLKRINKTLPVMVSKVSRIVSYNVPTFSHQQKVKEGKSLFHIFLSKATNLNKDVVRRIKKQIEGKDYQIIPGGYRFTQHLLNILAEPAPKERFSYNEMVVGINMFRHLLPSNAGKLALPESWACTTVKVNRDSFSGYMSSEMFGRNKGDIINESGNLAKLYYDHIISSKGFCFDVFAWSLGGREKRVSLAKTGEVTSRDTWMVEDVLNRIVSPVSENFMDMIKEQESYCPLFLGKTITQGKSHDYIETYVHGRVRLPGNEVTEGGWIIPIDYSKFSLRIYEELVICSMCIFSSYFNMEDIKVQKLMLFITNSVVNKNLVLPESGLTYQFTKGIPSGHTMTSILNTIVNFIVVSTALSQVGLNQKEVKSIRFLCAGDDTLIYVPYSVCLKELDKCFKKSGMLMDLPSEVAVPNNCRDPHLMPVFLKRCFYDYHKPVVWHEASLFENLFSPNKVKDINSIEGIKEEMERVYGIYKHAPFNEEHNSLLFRYIRYLEGLIRSYMVYTGSKIYDSEFLLEIQNLTRRKLRSREYKKEFYFPGFIAAEVFSEEVFSRVPVYVFASAKKSYEVAKNLGVSCFPDLVGRKGNSSWAMRLLEKLTSCGSNKDPP